MDCYLIGSKEIESFQEICFAQLHKLQHEYKVGTNVVFISESWNELESICPSEFLKVGRIILLDSIGPDKEIIIDNESKSITDEFVSSLDKYDLAIIVGLSIYDSGQERLYDILQNMKGDISVITIMPNITSNALKYLPKFMRGGISRLKLNFINIALECLTNNAKVIQDLSTYFSPLIELENL